MADPRLANRTDSSCSACAARGTKLPLVAPRVRPEWGSAFPRALPPTDPSASVLQRPIGSAAACDAASAITLREEGPVSLASPAIHSTKRASGSLIFLLCDAAGPSLSSAPAFPSIPWSFIPASRSPLLRSTNQDGLRRRCQEPRGLRDG
jgi:hypothetical protein